MAGLRILIALGGLIAASATAADTIQYRYDAQGRLISSDRRATGGNGARSLYFYDAASNRRKVQATGAFKPVQINAGTAANGGEGILSKDTRFLFIFQSDGNLVLYDQTMAAIWNAGTQNSGAVRAMMQSDGNFVLYRADGAPVWSTRTDGLGGNRLVVQDDGNVVIYTASGAAVWNTQTCCR